MAVVIPAFNEALTIESVLAELQALRRAQPRWEILPIVVNDGSTDETREVLARIASLYQSEYISLPLNLGIGRAVQAGLQLAVQLRADVALQLDGDGQHPAEQIPNIVEPVLAGETDVAVGSRYVSGAGGNVSSGLRQMGTYLFSGLLRALIGVRILDTTSGFRAFSAEATEYLARHYPDDYPEVQAYVPLARRGFRITERPVRMRARKRGHSSITPFRSLYYMVKVSIATVLERLRTLPERRTRAKKVKHGR